MLGLGLKEIGLTSMEHCSLMSINLNKLGKMFTLYCLMSITIIYGTILTSYNF